MFEDDLDGDAVFVVVHNDEEQYSVWWRERPLPLGWSDTGVAGTMSECLTHIERVWTDMRPRSLREQLAS